VSKRCSASVEHLTALPVSLARGPGERRSQLNVVLGQSGSWHIRVSFELGSLVATNFKEALTSLLPHHAEAASRQTPAPRVRRP
jgi:hypothetical protein